MRSRRHRSRRRDFAKRRIVCNGADSVSKRINWALRIASRFRPSRRLLENTRSRAKCLAGASALPAQRRYFRRERRLASRLAKPNLFRLTSRNDSESVTTLLCRCCTSREDREEGERGEDRERSRLPDSGVIKRGRGGGKSSAMQIRIGMHRPPEIAVKARSTPPSPFRPVAPGHRGGRGGANSIERSSMALPALRYNPSDTIRW